MRLLPILALGSALVVVRTLDTGAFLGVVFERSIVAVLFAGFIGYTLTVLWALRRVPMESPSHFRRFLLIFLGILLLALLGSGAITASPGEGLSAWIGSGFGPFTVWPSLTVTLGTFGLVVQATFARLIQLTAVSLLLALVVQRIRLQGRTSFCNRALGTGFGAGSLGATACPACGIVPLLVGAFSTAGAPLFWDPSSPLAAVFDVASVIGPLSVVLALKPGAPRESSILRFVVLPTGLIAPAIVAVLGMPDGASQRQGAIHDLYVLATIAALLLVLVTVILLIGFGIRYRARKQAPRDHRLTPGVRSGIQALYIAVPVVIVFGVGVLSYFVLLDLEETPDDAYEIDVMATQFAWRFTYPDDTSTINELRLRAGDPVVLHVTSDDVIHSLFIPDMGVKIDAAPGLVAQSWFQSHSEGRYPAYCVEYCGVGHAGMQANIVVYPSDGPRPTGETGMGPP